MFKIVVLNIGFMVVVLIPIFLPSLSARFVDYVPLQMILSAFGILCCSVYLAAVSLTVKSISDYSNFGFIDFFKNFKIALPAGLLMGLFIFLLYLVVSVILPFYLSFESVIGLALAAIVFWASFFALLSFQFYFTVYGRLGFNLKKSLKKCMIISLDNSGFSIFLLLHNFIALIISVLFVFLFPGPVGILIYLDEALRLRLLKYDWLEANPEANRRKIPWDEILIEEREKIGVRSLKNFIFPWKD